MKIDPTNRSSSITIAETYQVGSFSGSDTESDARAHDLPSISEEGTVKDGQNITQMQFESSSLKKKILKFFCCS